MNSPSSTTPRDKTFPVSAFPATGDGGRETGNGKRETEKSLSFLLVTPALDGWPRIRATVASVRQQATCVDSSTLRLFDFRTLHVVQVSDRSTDPSGEWLREQSDLLVRTEADAGLYDAIARGFQAGLTALTTNSGNGERETGNGETILSWLNSDEQLLPGALARVAEEFRRHPEADVVFGDYLLLDADGRPTAWRREIPAHGWLLRNGVNSILSCATFFRRRVWDSLGGFDPAFSLVADKDFYLRALAAGFRFRHLRGAPLAAYSNTGDNATLRHPLLALREQARLREKAGARGPAVRRLARGLRRILKSFHGCYGRRLLVMRLFDNEGREIAVSTHVGTRWEDPADEVARRRIRPSLSRRLAFTALGFAAIAARLFPKKTGNRQRATGNAPLLILEPFGLGDAIALQPLVRALCEAGREVRVGTQAAWFPVFPPHPNLRLFEAVPPWAARNGRDKYRGLLRRIRPFLRALRAEARGAIGIDPRGDVRSILALHLAGCVRVETLERYYTANDCPVPAGAAQVRHPIVRTVPRWQLNGVFALDLDLSPPDLRFLLGKSKSQRVEKSESQVEESKNPRLRVALLPMTPWIGKRWLLEGWREVVRGIRERGAEPCAFCGPGEEEETAAALGGADVPLRVCADVGAWARELAGATAAIAVNTGPMHVASALGIPVVLLEGSSRQPLWAPPRRPYAVVSHQAEVPCAPCHQVGDCQRCGRRCMALVRADEVLSALDGLNVL